MSGKEFVATLRGLGLAVLRDEVMHLAFAARWRDTLNWPRWAERVATVLAGSELGALKVAAHVHRRQDTGIRETRPRFKPGRVSIEGVEGLCRYRLTERFGRAVHSAGGRNTQADLCKTAETHFQ